MFFTQTQINAMLLLNGSYARLVVPVSLRQVGSVGAKAGELTMMSFFRWACFLILPRMDYVSDPTARGLVMRGHSGLTPWKKTWQMEQWISKRKITQLNHPINTKWLRIYSKLCCILSCKLYSLKNTKFQFTGWTLHYLKK